MPKVPLVIEQGVPPSCVLVSAYLGLMPEITPSPNPAKTPDSFTILLCDIMSFHIKGTYKFLRPNPKPLHPGPDHETPAPLSRNMPPTRQKNPKTLREPP